MRNQISPANHLPAGSPEAQNRALRRRLRATPPFGEPALEVAIGEEVRSTRRLRGLTVSELAAVADISISMLSKVEHGTISPSLKTLLGLSRALGVPLSRLFSRFKNETSGPHLLR